MKIQMTPERLEEIEDKHLLHGAEEWTNEEDVETEAAIKELIAAYKTSQQALAEMKEEDELFQSTYDMVISEKCASDEIHCTCVPILRIEIAELRKQLADAVEERDDIQADNLKALELIVEGQTAEVKLIAQLAEARLENTKLESKLETAKTHRKISEAEVKRLQDEIAQYSGSVRNKYLKEYWKSGK